MEIEYVTHASLLLRSGGRALLTDPFYWYDSLPASCMGHFPPRDLQPSDLGRVDFLYSSHLHPDHSHPATLLAIKDQVGRVLLPADRPALVDRFRSLGFDDLIVLEKGGSVALDAGLTVTSWWSDDVDTCLVADMDGVTVLHMNDCLPSADVVARMAEQHRIDYAFVLYTSAQELYPYLLPYPAAVLDRLGKEREEAFLSDQLKRLDALAPRVVVPYSMTMTYHSDVALNGYGRLTPPEFAGHVKQKSLIIQPGDVIDTETDRVRRYRDENLWGNTLEEYLQHIRAHDFQAPPFDPGRVDGIEKRLLPVLSAFVRSQPDGEMADYMPALAKGILLNVKGRDGTRTWHVSHESATVRETSSGFALVEMTIPASLVEALLDGIYDPYSLLFLHKIKFRLHHVQLDPKTECALYVAAVMLLLTDSWRTWMHFKEE